jgi:hypothetical protein
MFDHTGYRVPGAQPVCFSWGSVLVPVADGISAKTDPCLRNEVGFRSRRVVMKFKCLLCGVECGDPQATESDISHGYCPKCIRKRYTQRIHEAQVRAGDSDCFNRGYNGCGEEHCCFRVACQDDLIGKWKKAIIHTIEVADPEGLINTS